MGDKDLDADIDIHVRVPLSIESSNVERSQENFKEKRGETEIS